MKHRVGFNRLSRSAAHRLSLHRNMATSLFRYERITTTKAKALAVRRTAEKMITRAKVDSVHNRRTIAKDIKDKEVLAKLFTEIGPRFVSRPGGYTRILKLGRRKGDAAEMVILELVEKKQEEKKPAKAKKAKAVKEDKKANEVKKAEAPKAEADAAPVPAEEEKKEAAPAAE
ncbi:50S ribosomal protein L17 [Sediminispirochaeta bajacaliforniensis]|uniref:50S ribosomal protein L17 n=1 Tax=Sediminispirochaeta bajacaliforniensis TaxID=148 RepID=UPI000365664E|nr:50S ribosomal protein L17 [Sediminispirochaeta bajacaliforniensis]